MLAVALLSICCLCHPAAAAEKSPRRCSQKDLAGLWVMYGILPGAETLNPMTRYQAYRFNSDGSFLRASNNNPFTEPLLKMAFLQKSVGDTYAIDGKGVVTMRFPGVAQPDVAVCGVLIKASETTFPDGRPSIKHQAGDIALTYFNRSMAPRFQLYLRKHQIQAAR